MHQDEDQLLQTTRQAADQLRELFEADAAYPAMRTVEDAAARDDRVT